MTNNCPLTHAELDKWLAETVMGYKQLSWLGSDMWGQDASINNHYGHVLHDGKKYQALWNQVGGRWDYDFKDWHPTQDHNQAQMVLDRILDTDSSYDLVFNLTDSYHADQIGRLISDLLKMTPRQKMEAVWRALQS